MAKFHNFKILMLHVKFENNWCSAFRKKLFKLIKYVILYIGIGAK